MKVVQLTPGAGENFYCENCMRDAALLRALRARGVDALSLPLYLPPLNPDTGQPSEVDGGIYFGGINVYLQQKSALFRHTPRFVDRLFDAEWLLNLAGKRTGMTDAHMLGELTLSMLRGEHGRQSKELARLVAHLESERPDVLLVSNALLVGMVRTVREATGCSVLCWVQDEDSFLDDLPEPYRQQAWDELTARAEDVDLFLSPSVYYGRLMAERLGLGEDRIGVVAQGIEPHQYADARPADPPIIGYLGQFAEHRGLDLLVEALGDLRGDPAHADVRLHAMGGATKADEPFLGGVRARVAALGLDNAVTIDTHFEQPAKRDFLRDLAVLAVPTRRPEAYARYALEAWASAVPVVLPDHGGQGELVHETEAGLVHVPGDAADLAGRLRAVLSDPGTARKLGLLGQAAVRRRYDMPTTARTLADLCKRLRETKP